MEFISTLHMFCSDTSAALTKVIRYVHNLNSSAAVVGVTELIGQND
jgi:HPt (histidine-containing phosphotransfer) domain-containing protein